MKQNKSAQTEESTDDTEALAFSFPTFDPSKYYGIAGEVATLASVNSEADPMAVYVSFLTAAAAMLGRSKYIELGDSRQYARIFSALVGASSRSRKGTSFKSVKQIITKTEAEYNTRFINKKFEKLAIFDGGLSSAEGLIYEVRDVAEQTTGKGKTPLWEAVVDKRLLVVEEELGNIFKMIQRTGNSLSATLRKAWDGGDLAPGTKNKRLRASDPHINVLGHITQYELKSLMSNTDIHNGLANRFLWVCTRRLKKMAFPKAMASRKVRNLAINLADALKKSEDEQLVKISIDARRYWRKQYHNISTDNFGLRGGITSRDEAHVLRLSLLFCLLDGLSEIQQRHMEAAVDLVAFCNLSVEYIFSTPEESEADTDADKLLKALEQKSMSQTEVSRLFSGHKTKSQLTLLLTELQTLYKIKCAVSEGSRKIIWEKINH
jgi:hypothetical protein